MKRKKGSVRLWAVVFWLLVWEGASLVLAATTGGRMLLLASPVGALRRLLAAGGNGGLLAGSGLFHGPDSGGISPGLRAGSGAGGPGGPPPVGAGSAQSLWWRW